jgi:hypothetical protein
MTEKSFSNLSPDVCVCKVPAANVYKRTLTNISGQSNDKMKSSTSLVFWLLLPILAISAKNVNRDEGNLDESIEEFEKEFNQLFNDPEAEKAAAAVLAKAEAEIKVYSILARWVGTWEEIETKQTVLKSNGQFIYSGLRGLRRTCPF